MMMIILNFYAFTAAGKEVITTFPLLQAIPYSLMHSRTPKRT